MSRKNEASTYLLAGMPPSRIAEKMGISVSSVMGYLFNQVGEGRIRRTDIVFSIDRKTRQAIEEFLSERSLSLETIQRRLEKRGIMAVMEDVRIYIQLRDARVELGDLYESLREIETFLHSLVRETLIAEYGVEQWWRAGIPPEIRSDCAALRERDDSPAEEPFCYTTLIQIRKIFDNQWGLLSRKIPKKLAGHKSEFLSKLAQINVIRNAVMHPCKGLRISEDSFRLVKDFLATLGPDSSMRQLRYVSFANLEASPLIN